MMKGWLAVLCGVIFGAFAALLLWPWRDERPRPPVPVNIVNTDEIVDGVVDEVKRAATNKNAAK